METLKKFRNIVIAIASFLVAVAAISVSPYIPATQGALEAHAEQEKQTHEETDDKARLARLRLEKRLTQAEIRHAKSEGNQDDLVEFRDDLKAINEEIRELKKKLGIS